IAIAVAAALILRPRTGAQSDGTNVAESLSVARAAMQREDWEAAQRTYERVLEKDLTSSEAKAKLTLVKEFAVHRQLITSAEQALERNDKVAAMTTVMRIPMTSVYAERAQKLATRITELQH